MGAVAGVWQGNYGSNGTLQSAPGGPPMWTPMPGVSYLVMAQSTVATPGTHEYTVGVEFSLEAGGAVFMSRSSTAKVASGGPSTAPMVYLQWQCPPDWTGGDISLNASAIGNSPHLSSSCCFSIVVMEIEQPDPEA